MLPSRSLGCASEREGAFLTVVSEKFLEDDLHSEFDLPAADVAQFLVCGPKVAEGVPWYRA